VTTILFEAYTNAQLKIAHSYKVRKVMKDNLLLGVGMNLFFFQNAFTLKSNPKEIQFENSDSIYFLNDAKKT